MLIKGKTMKPLQQQTRLRRQAQYQPLMHLILSLPDFSSTLCEVQAYCRTAAEAIPPFALSLCVAGRGCPLMCFVVRCGRLAVSRVYPTILHSRLGMVFRSHRMLFHHSFPPLQIKYNGQNLLPVRVRLWPTALSLALWLQGTW